MSNNIETAICNLVNILVQHNSIRAIGMSGGERPFPEPGEGDIDLFIYCTEIPTGSERQKMLMSLRGKVEQVEIGKLASGHCGNSTQPTTAKQTTEEPRVQCFPDTVVVHSYPAVRKSAR
jgi:hypothetical protein